MRPVLQSLSRPERLSPPMHCRQVLPESWLQQLAANMDLACLVIGSAQTQLSVMRQQAGRGARRGRAASAAQSSQVADAMLQAHSAVEQRVAAGKMGYRTTCDGCGRVAVGLRKCGGCARVAY